MKLTNFYESFGRILFGKILVSAITLAVVFSTTAIAQDAAPQPAQPPFPDTDTLMSRVASHQKDVETLLTQYTFTDRTTMYVLDKTGKVRGQHTDTYYVTPTPYEVFTLHISHDNKPLPQQNLEHQEKQIEHKLKDYERKAQKNPNARPKDALLFADIILKSRFEPLRWEGVDGTPTVIYSFEPKSTPLRHGSSDDKIASDMKGKMWINPDAAEIIRMEFTSVSPLGLDFMVKVKSFQGVVDQRKINGEVWMPSRQDFVADGRALVKGFHVREVSEFSDYLKATTDVFQQVHASNKPTADEIKGQQ